MDALPRAARPDLPHGGEAAPSEDPKAGQPPASPQRAKPVRAGWKATLLRRETFLQLRALQKSTNDFTLDLSCLTDACVRMAREQGSEAIVQRALADLADRLPQSSTNHP